MDYIPVPGLVCFVCQWNEGRSVHLELSVRAKLRKAESSIQLISAGFQESGGVNALRKDFLLNLGVPLQEIEAHRSTVFGPEHAKVDLVLVAELAMKERLLTVYPRLKGHIMTVKGFAMGLTPGNENLTEAEACMEDAGGKPTERKLALYDEHEALAGQVANRLISMEKAAPNHLSP